MKLRLGFTDEQHQAKKFHIPISIPMEAFDREWNKNAGLTKSSYVGPLGKGQNGKRYEDFHHFTRRLAAPGQLIEAPKLGLTDYDNVLRWGFINGQHRTAWMRDHG